MARPAPQPLSTLLRNVAVKDIRGNVGVAVAHITHDSRNVRTGTLFVAYRGVYQDVHQYIPDAVSRGAAAVVVERPLDELQDEIDLPDHVTFVQVSRARRARSELACALHGNPAGDLTVIGVTGTDGKTTTSTLIHAVLTAAGQRAGLVSTVAAEVGGATLDTGLHTTTPEPEDLHAYLADMRDAGLQVAVLEVTSHGLAQDRVTHVGFDVGVITNITREALEYHETQAAYARAKARLFHLVAVRAAADGLGVAVLNADDPSYTELSRITASSRLSYSVSSDADFTAHDINHAADGLTFTAITPRGRLPVRSPLLGSYNVANILAAMAVGHALDVDADAWLAGVAAVHGIPGRMELIDEGQGYLALVDFAHTANALRSALVAARDMRQGNGRVIVVFGCAGLRDRGKRPLMGRAAGELADLTIVTAEDPRTEDLDSIMRAVVRGLMDAGARESHEYALVPDRFRAIRRAVAMAGPGDVVLVAGKGHEKSMCFGEDEYAWDDRKAVRAALRGESYGSLPTAMHE